MPPTSRLRYSPNAAKPRKSITTPKELAARMAQLAQRLRDTIAQAFTGEKPSDLLIRLRRACGAAMLPELAQLATTGQFADLFAQTVVYGLFTARCADPAWRFRRRLARAALPTSNPFLSPLFETITDREPYAGLITTLAQLLDDTDLDAVLESLVHGSERADPVVHFYESFLAAYDPGLRKTRGVYYTPEPVVSFIVRAVDDLLKCRFDVPAGLADQQIPPRVLIVDPACGTGSFLASVIELIREHFLKQPDLPTWSSYVHRCLLPRLHGFELLPASYVVAHLHLGGKLTGQDLPAGPLRERCVLEFPSAKQLGVHLTNSLEEVATGTEQLLGNCVNKKRLGMLSATPDHAESVRADRPILVVLGNPPYRGISASHGKWIAGLLEDYRLVNGVPLGEKKVWLKNDYVQFIRFGQWGIERAGQGILALVTDHSYLDSATFRGMRQQLLRTFDEIYLLNLHGNAKRRERAHDGGRDENVFAIRQGVVIALFLKHGKTKESRPVFYADLWGSRQSKAGYLAVSRLEMISWKRITPASPGYELVAVNRKSRAEYDRGWLVKDIFPVASSGVQTSRDHLVVAFDEQTLLRRLQSFLAAEKTDEEVRNEFFAGKSVGNYPPGDTREWRLGEARNSLRQQRSWRQAITTCLYRPFDERSLLYLDRMIDWPRREVMSHLQQSNYALCIGRAGLVASGTWDLVFCVKQICDHNLFYRGSSLNFPLYLYPSGELPQGVFETASGVLPNLSTRFVEKVTETLGLRFVADRPGDLRKTVGPENILHYTYAILHSSTYRRRYAEFLKFDFPRLPLTADTELFRALCARGQNLVRLHLLEKEGSAATTFPVQGDNIVRKVRYVEPDLATGQGRVWINDTQYFHGVPPEVWQFHVGGYRVCQKWLKDRKGRRLSSAEQARYMHIVGALAESVRVVGEIDALIEKHGGWPIQASER